MDRSREKRKLSLVQDFSSFSDRGSGTEQVDDLGRQAADRFVSVVLLKIVLGSIPTTPAKSL
jgi:hypothetical protein